MQQQFEQAQKLSKDGYDAALKTFGSVSQGAQAIALEVADYTKKSFEQGTAALEQLTAARSLEKAVEIQSAYIRESYEGLVAQTSKLGTLYANLAKDTMKPFEGFSAGQGRAA